MTDFETYRLFQSLNNHFFESSYDYFKYQGQVNVKQETYDAKRPDEKSKYERLGRKFPVKEDLENYMVSILLESPKRMWVGVLFGGDSDDVYLRWLERTKNLQATVIDDLKRLLDIPPWEDSLTFNDLFKCEAGQHPEILKANMRRVLSFETFAVLDLILNFIPRLDLKLGDDRNWLEAKNKVIKYRPFLNRLNIDLVSLRKAISQAMKEIGENS